MAAHDLAHTGENSTRPAQANTPLYAAASREGGAERPRFIRFSFNREFQTPEILIALEQLHTRITTPEQKRDVARAMNKTRRHLR